MDYKKIYDAIIAKRILNPYEGYVETHHILPRSLGGSDEKSNLVALSAREHFICHLLLVKIHENSPNYYKMVKAFFMMQTESDNQNRHINSKKYERLKIAFSEAQRRCQSGTGNSQYGKFWIHSKSLRISKKISKYDAIPEGWKVGRIVNFDKHEEKMKSLNVKKVKTEEIKICRKRNQEQMVETEEIKICRKRNQEQMVETLSNWYKLYASVGFDEFVKITGYEYSKPNLVSRFAKWVPEFVPQNGKRRKKNNSTVAD